MLALVSLGVLGLAGSASADLPCSRLIADYRGGYEGPRLKGFACKMPEDPLPGEGRETTWTVPPRVSAAAFFVIGAAGASTGHGGEVEAALALTPGETLTLLFGVDGNATSVSRGGVPLIVAAGSDGRQASYVAPGARNTALRGPGLPAPPYPQNGSVYVTWLSGGSKGQAPSDCVVPELRGESPVEARETLARNNCRTGSIGRQLARPASRGLVIGQLPKPGSVMPKMGTVDLTVGRGR